MSRGLRGSIAGALAAAMLAGCGSDAPKRPAAGPGSLPPCASTTIPSPRLPRTVLATVHIGGPADDVLATDTGWWFASGASGIDVVFAGAPPPQVVRHIALPDAV